MKVPLTDEEKKAVFINNSRYAVAIIDELKNTDLKPYEINMTLISAMILFFLNHSKDTSLKRLLWSVERGYAVYEQVFKSAKQETKVQ